jgi:uncharacterized protein YjiS (DUF1127 family)
MSFATTGFRSFAPTSPAAPAGPGGHLRRWLAQRRQAAVLAQVDQRLCDDAGLPTGAAIRAVSPRPMLPAG